MPFQVGAFNSASLRGVAQRPPYVHTDQLSTVRDLLVDYNEAPRATFDSSELTHPLKLNEEQLSEIEAFRHTLDGSTSNQ